MKTTRRNFGEGNKTIDLKIAYIGGGSRGWAHNLMKDLAACPSLGGEIRLYDIDRAMAAFNARYGNWLQGHPDCVSKWKYRTVNSLKEALVGADFVFLSIQPGAIELMKVDLEEPMKFGVYQSVGDTVGPGGCIRALRTVKDYKVFAEAIAEYSPKSWCLNFTNPMTVCVRALSAVFPAIKAYGCCHEVFGTQAFLGDLYARQTKETKPARSEVNVNILGINHFTWMNKASCRGRNLLAMLDRHLDKPGVIRKCKKDFFTGSNYFDADRQVAFDLYRKFKVLAAAGDRHLAEFVPWYLTSKDSCYRWGFVLTPYSYRKQRLLDAPREFKKEFESNKFPALSKSGEEYINQMLALLGKTTFRTNVNLPNRGQMGKIPEGAVVETNAIFTKNSVKPVSSGALPDTVNILVLRHVINQESLVKAVLSSDRDLAFQAFAGDPLVSRLPMDNAWKLFNDMIRKTKFRF